MWFFDCSCISWLSLAARISFVVSAICPLVAESWYLHIHWKTKRDLQTSLIISSPERWVSITSTLANYLFSIDWWQYITFSLCWLWLCCDKCFCRDVQVCSWCAQRHVQSVLLRVDREDPWADSYYARCILNYDIYATNCTYSSKLLQAVH